MSKTFKILLLLFLIAAVIFFAYFFRASVPGISVYGVTSKISKFFCDISKGDWVTSGCGIGACTWECNHAYTDSGKACTNSKQCKGRCIVTSPKMNDFLESEPKALKNCTKISDKKYRCNDASLVSGCEPRQPRCFDSVWEYNDGVLEQWSRVCAAG